MKSNKLNTNKLVISKFVYIIVFFLFIIFSVSLGYRCLVDYEAVDGVSISEFINNRNTVEDILLPERGTIYDVKGNVLAQDVSSYTLIAYLDSSRTVDKKMPRHVVDKENTAKVLAEYIDTDYDRILEILNKKAYQVEFGNGGKNISQLEMEKIRDLNLPGIDFIKSTRRYYPNGDFASYLIGYTKNKEMEDGNTYMVGELGIEGNYNKELTGKSGYITYEKDGRGNRIANSNEYREDAINGDNVYLTIDSNIQLFIENAVKSAEEKSKAEWIVMGIMDAKTGAILGFSSTPSYDPNIRNLTNYMDPLVSYTYEPGSTMKTFSYMCAIESGKYNGNDTFISGSKTYKDKDDTVTIKDWNNGKGWGRISYDFGFAMSSNIGVANMMQNVITKKELKACYDKYGFGKTTGIALNNELAGNVEFTYDIEAATAGYGQGIMVTPIQMMQGMTIISNDGRMLKPYVVSKITDASGKTIFNSKKEEGEVLVSEGTITKIKELLRSVIADDITKGTGYIYKMEGYDLIGKTGTASIFEKGRYLTGDGNYIYSFSGLYPGDNPEIIIYMAVKKPKDSTNYVAPAVKDVLVSVSKYLSITESKSEIKHITTEDYSNKNVSDISKKLKESNIKVLVLGNGEKVINQYPKKGITIYEGDMIVLRTNNYDKEMIDLTGFSYKEAREILTLMGVEYELKGYGYVSNQSVSKGEKVDKKVTVEFKGLY